MNTEEVRNTIPTILTDEVRSIIRTGLERGILIFQGLDAKSRDTLGQYADNSEARNFFSALCKGIEDAVQNASLENWEVASPKKNNSHYIEVSNASFMLHLRARHSDVPDYMMQRIEQFNKEWMPGKQLFIQLVYEKQDNTIKTAEFMVMDENKNKISFPDSKLVGNWLFSVVEGSKAV